MKKLIATILALSIVVSAFGVAAFAENSETYTYIKGYGNEISNSDENPDATLSEYSFHEGMATTVKFPANGRAKNGVIDKTGKTIVPIKYDVISDFCEGLACVVLVDKDFNRKCGFIDKTGKEVIPLKYEFANSFKDGYALVCNDGGTGYIDKTGKEIVPIGKYGGHVTLSEGIIVTRQKDTNKNVVNTMMDIDGKVICTLPYESVSDFTDGIATVYDNDKVGLIDKTGKLIVPLKYNYVGRFSDGMAEIGVKGKNKQMKRGFIDKTGKEIVPAKYDYVRGFSDGMAYTSLSGKISYINTAGEEVIKVDYDSANNFHDGIAVVGNLDKNHKHHYGYIDKTGKKITDLIYDEANMSMDGRARVERDGKYGFIDTTGKEVIPVTYYNVLNFSEGLVMVGNKNEKDVVTYSFVDKDGKVVIPNIAISPKTTFLDWLYEFFNDTNNQNDDGTQKIEETEMYDWSDFFEDYSDDEDNTVIIDDPVSFAK